jgi:hypothetical protein
MAIQKNCLSCKKEYWGNRNKVFCSDACRKYASRHPELISKYYLDPSNNSLDLLDKPLEKEMISPVKNTGNYGQRRTVADKVIEHLAKRTIDKLMGVGGQSGKKENLADKNELINHPLKMKTLDSNFNLNGNFSLLKFINTPQLGPKMKEFLGDISLPFQMLIWGLPGQGKSTFSMKLASEFCKFSSVLIVAGEEDLDSNTFIKRVSGIFEREEMKGIKAVSRLPINSEWQQALSAPVGQKEVRCIIYDSINVLGLSPNHAKTVFENPTNSFLNQSLGHIYISQAQKDGKAYMGNAAWGHEVDVIVKVMEGKAIIEKNRFANNEHGKSGAEYLIF